MQTIMIFILLTILCAEAGGILCRKAPEKMILPFFLGIPLYLFPWYCLDLLPIGMRSLLLLCAALIALGFYRGLRKKIRLSSLLTPGIALFVVFAAVFFVLTRDRQVSLWDELRLWGALPKLLHNSQTLQLGPDTGIFSDYQSYPPGIGLFLYAVMYFQEPFEDWVLFWGYAMFGMSFFLPLTSGLTWRSWGRLLPFGAAVVLLPCIFFSSGADSAYYYGSLFIDPILGIAAGCGLYLAATLEDKPNSRMLFGLLLGSMTLLKDSAALFAGLWLFVYLYRIWQKDRRLPMRQLIQLLLSFAPILLWKMMLQVHSVSVLKDINLLEFRLSYVTAFLHALATVPITFFPDSLPLPAWLCTSFVLCFCVFLALDIFLSRRSRKTCSAVCTLAVVVGIILFYYGYFTIYYEYLESLQRYTGTLLTMYLFYLFAGYWTELAHHRFSISWKSWLPVQLAMVCVIVVFFRYYTFRLEQRDTYSDVKARASHVAEYLAQTAGKNEIINVYLVTESVSVHHHIIYFHYLDTNIRIRNFYYDATLPGVHIKDADAFWDSVEELGCSYLYIEDADGIQDVFREIVPDCADDTLYHLENRTLYRIG